MEDGRGALSVAHASFGACSSYLSALLAALWRPRWRCIQLCLEGEVIMARKTSILGFSVSLALAKEYERLAEREGTTKSDLACRMMITYKADFLRMIPSE